MLPTHKFAIKMYFDRIENQIENQIRFFLFAILDFFSFVRNWVQTNMSVKPMFHPKRVQKNRPR